MKGWFNFIPVHRLPSLNNVFGTRKNKAFYVAFGLCQVRKIFSVLKCRSQGIYRWSDLMPQSFPLRWIPSSALKQLKILIKINFNSSSFSM